MSHLTLRTVFLSMVFATVLSAPPCHADTPRIAIIIDDLGYQLEAGQRAIRLPGPVAYAVLPKTPRAVELAEMAHAAGKDVLLHQPLQSVSNIGAADPGAIVLDMSREQLLETLASNLAAVPYVVGINNHRGSLLTRHPGHMQWLMQAISSRGGLFFLDSYTTHQSVALQLARENGVPAIKRDVFLDADPDPLAITREFQRLKDLALKNGFAVGIGHPFAATMEVLERELPQLEEQGFLLVGIGPLVGGLKQQRAPDARAYDSGDSVAD